MPSVRDLSSTRLDLDVVAWTQSITNPNRSSTVSFEAIKRVNSRPVRMPGLGNVMELPFVLTCRQGPPADDAHLMPEGSIGYLSPHDSDAEMPVCVRCSIWLADDCFADLWQRLRAGSGLDPSLSLNAGPVSRATGDHLVWDRAESKFLFVDRVEFRFEWRRTDY
jgi:hypothetical protein